MKIGDRVTWKTQRGEIQVILSGQIVGVVPAGSNPYRLEDFAYDQFAAVSESGVPVRDHESYLVAVEPAGGDEAKRRLYWPRVGALLFQDVTGGVFGGITDYSNPSKEAL